MKTLFKIFLALVCAYLLLALVLWRVGPSRKIKEAIPAAEVYRSASLDFTPSDLLKVLLPPGVFLSGERLTVRVEYSEEEISMEDVVKLPVVQGQFLGCKIRDWSSLVKKDFEKEGMYFVFENCLFLGGSSEDLNLLLSSKKSDAPIIHTFGDAD